MIPSTRAVRAHRCAKVPRKVAQYSGRDAVGRLEGLPLGGSDLTPTGGGTLELVIDAEPGKLHAFLRTMAGPLGQQLAHTLTLTNWDDFSGQQRWTSGSRVRVLGTSNPNFPVRVTATSVTLLTAATSHWAHRFNVPDAQAYKATSKSSAGNLSLSEQGARRQAAAVRPGLKVLVVRPKLPDGCWAGSGATCSKEAWNATMNARDFTGVNTVVSTCTWNGITLGGGVTITDDVNLACPARAQTCTDLFNAVRDASIAALATTYDLGSFDHVVISPSNLPAGSITTRSLAVHWTGPTQALRLTGWNASDFFLSYQYDGGELAAGSYAHTVVGPVALPGPNIALTGTGGLQAVLLVHQDPAISPVTQDPLNLRHTVLPYGRTFALPGTSLVVRIKSMSVDRSSVMVDVCAKSSSQTCTFANDFHEIGPEYLRLRTTANPTWCLAVCNTAAGTECQPGGWAVSQQRAVVLKRDGCDATDDWSLWSVVGSSLRNKATGWCMDASLIGRFEEGWGQPIVVNQRGTTGKYAMLTFYFCVATTSTFDAALSERYPTPGSCGAPFTMAGLPANGVTIFNPETTTCGAADSWSCRAAPDFLYLLPSSSTARNIIVDTCVNGVAAWDTFLFVIPTITTSDDDGSVCGGVRSRVNFTAVGGVAYWVVVEGFSQTHAPVQQALVHCLVPAGGAGDLAATYSKRGCRARSVDKGLTQYTDDQSYNCWSCRAAPDFLYLLPSSSTPRNIIVDTCVNGVAAWDTFLFVIPTVVASDDDKSRCRELRSRVNFTAAGGVAYWVVVEGYDITHAIKVYNDDGSICGGVRSRVNFEAEGGVAYWVVVEGFQFRHRRANRTGQIPLATDTNAVPDELQEEPQQEQHLRSAAFLPWQERRERSDAATRFNSEQRKREYVESAQQHQERLAAQMTALQSVILRHAPPVRIIMCVCVCCHVAFLEALNAAHHPLALYPPQQIRTDSFSQAFFDYLRPIDRLLSMPSLLPQCSDLQAKLLRGAFSDCVPQDGYVHCVAGDACNKTSYAGVAKATRYLEQHTETYLQVHNSELEVKLGNLCSRAFAEGVTDETAAIAACKDSHLTIKTSHVGQWVDQQLRLKALEASGSGKGQAPTRLPSISLSTDMAQLQLRGLRGPHEQRMAAAKLKCMELETLEKEKHHGSAEGESPLIARGLVLMVKGQVSRYRTQVEQLTNDVHELGLQRDRMGQSDKDTRAASNAIKAKLRTARHLLKEAALYQALGSGEDAGANSMTEEQH
ncbi:hypothetical protein QJQ45_012420 [Haematococcus lacustris]|nr:hypothetical protein QJQ45_012420 [Haematococcus lacustris]